MSNRALGLVREVIHNAGMELSYAYEDLIFMEHNGFLLQFSDKDNELFIHVNEEANEQELEWPISLLQKKGTELGLLFHKGRHYKLTETDTDNFQLEFCQL